MTGSHADMSRHVKMYFGVFAALFVATVATVAVSRIELGHVGHITLALAIAVFKASLVAAIFMHLKWEKTKWIWWPLAICAFFFVVLLAIPTLTTNETEARAHYGAWDTLPSHEAPAEDAHGEHGD